MALQVNCVDDSSPLHSSKMLKILFVIAVLLVAQSQSTAKVKLQPLDPLFYDLVSLNKADGCIECFAAAILVVVMFSIFGDV